MPMVAYGAPPIMTVELADTEKPKLSMFRPSAAVSLALNFDVVFQPDAGMTKRSTAPWPCQPGAPPAILFSLLSTETEYPRKLDSGCTVKRAVSVILRQP